MVRKRLSLAGSALVLANLVVSLSSPTAGAADAADSFASYPAPNEASFYEHGIFGQAPGVTETSIGVDPKTNAVLLQTAVTTARVTFAGNPDRPTASWKDVTDPLNHQ